MNNPFENQQKQTGQTGYKNPFGIKKNPSMVEANVEISDGWGNDEAYDLGGNEQQEKKAIFGNKGKTQNTFGVKANNQDFFNINEQQQPPMPQQNINTFNTQNTGFQQQELQGQINLTEQQPALSYPTPSIGQNYDYENEPPILEELGIDLVAIKERTKAVILLRKCDEKFLQDPDMGGPILFIFILGTFLTLTGKFQFGSLIGFGISGSSVLYFVLNSLSQHERIPLYNTMSIIGYCIVPIMVLAGLNIFLTLKSGVAGIIATFVCISLSTYLASNFFNEVLHLSHQKALAAYPIFLFYFLFVIITVF